MCVHNGFINMITIEYRYLISKIEDMLDKVDGSQGIL